MSDPMLFETATPRFGLPLLYAGQSQKEAFVNEAHALLDALMHCAVDGEMTEPPAEAEEGSCWLVGETATGAWAGQAGAIACRQSGNWLFHLPRDGMLVFDRATGQQLRYFGGWKIPEVPMEPTGGSFVDIEARAALAELIAALRVAGTFSSS